MKPENGEQNLPNNSPDEEVVDEKITVGIEEPELVPTTTPTICRTFRWISRWIFSYESTYLPLVILWMLGVVWAISEMMRALPAIIKREEAGAFTLYFIILVKFQLLLGFLHQFVVFRCIHIFDSEKEIWASRFPNWIGTSWEWGIRAMILLSLLGVGGEIPLLAKHIRDSYHHHLHEIPIYTYPLCSVILYFLLIIWDICGAISAPQRDNKLLKLWKLLWPARPLTLRQVYFYSDGLCFIFWIAILWCAKDNRIGPLSFLFVISTTIIFTVMTIYRFAYHVKSQAA